MRAAETLSAVFFATFACASLIVPLARDKRGKAIGIGAAGVIVSLLLPRVATVPGGSVVRDFTPGFLLLMGYWQTGQFMVGADARFQGVLERFDARWFPRAERMAAGLGAHRVLAHYLEVAYMACYPVVPLGVATLYALGRQDAVADYWRVVLPATYATHALTTVFQSWPPWMADSAPIRDPATSALRSMNQWITDNASIRANSFPSGHVASSSAIGLVVFDVAPGAGVVFLWIAASIAGSSVLLRYHYVLDVILGIGLAGAAYGLLR